MKGTLLKSSNRPLGNFSQMPIVEGFIQFHEIFQCNSVVAAKRWLPTRKTKVWSSWSTKTHWKWIGYTWWLIHWRVRGVDTWKTKRYISRPQRQWRHIVSRVFGVADRINCQWDHRAGSCQCFCLSDTARECRYMYYPLAIQFWVDIEMFKDATISQQHPSRTSILANLFIKHLVLSFSSFSIYFDHCHHFLYSFLSTTSSMLFFFSFQLLCSLCSRPFQTLWTFFVGSSHGFFALRDALLSLSAPSFLCDNYSKTTTYTTPQYYFLQLEDLPQVS